jgi:hypothetical protein
LTSEAFCTLLNKWRQKKGTYSEAFICTYYLVPEAGFRIVNNLDGPY